MTDQWQTIGWNVTGYCCYERDGVQYWHDVREYIPKSDTVTTAQQAKEMVTTRLEREIGPILWWSNYLPLQALPRMSNA